MKKFISGACLLMLQKLLYLVGYIRVFNPSKGCSSLSLAELRTVDHELLRLDNKFPVFYSLSESVLGALQVDFRTSSTWN
ncbi:unnamed protein product [Rhizophagus irregularis]|nr:unnamed protein product [Rhizophagus irregularis]CAB4432609.1 unnamed protein product [Rhizophagus irregularis]